MPATRVSISRSSPLTAFSSSFFFASSVTAVSCIMLGTHTHTTTRTTKKTKRKGSKGSTSNAERAEFSSAPLARSLAHARAGYDTCDFLLIFLQVHASRALGLCINLTYVHKAVVIPASLCAAAKWIIYRGSSRSCTRRKSHEGEEKKELLESCRRRRVYRPVWLPGLGNQYYREGDAAMLARENLGSRRERERGRSRPFGSTRNVRTAKWLLPARRQWLKPARVYIVVPWCGRARYLEWNWSSAGWFFCFLHQRIEVYTGRGEKELPRVDYCSWIFALMEISRRLACFGQVFL